MDTIEVNGTEGVMDQDPIEITQNGVVEEPAPGLEEDTDSAPTYAEAFPPLGAGSKTEEASGSAWAKSSSVKKPAPAQIKKAPIQSSIINTVLRVPYEERRYKNLMPVIGDGVRQNDAIKEVMQKTNTQIEVSVTKDQSLTIMVSGKRDAVANARSQILRALQSQGSMEIEIPREHHRFILGRGGKRLQELELMTATKINIPRDSDIIRIVGSKEGMDRARHEMQLVSDEQAKLGFERVMVPKIYHPFICGANNSTAKEIANKTGARINIPPPSVDKDELTVAGEKEGVIAAVNMINEVYKQKEKRCKTVSVEVKKTQHRYVIGPRGQGLQDVLAATGVSVEVPSAEDETETITLRGEPDKLGQALTLVYDKANSVVASEVHAPQWLHRFIIGRNGQNIKKITQDLEKLHIEFIDGKDVILLEGPPEEVQHAEELLDTSISELKSTMSFDDVEVDPKWHRHIIGKAGSNITRIKNETGTSINIPSDTEKSNIIHIEGSPEGVAAAREEILAMAAKFSNERSKDIIIEQRFHKNIIGQKGEKVREIREKFGEVQISFPEAGIKSDIVTLRGPKEQVEQCYNFLKKLAADLVASNFRMEVGSNKISG
jgi:transcription antitermination factor NusA-like protein